MIFTKLFSNQIDSFNKEEELIAKKNKEKILSIENKLKTCQDEEKIKKQNLITMSFLMMNF